MTHIIIRVKDREKAKVLFEFLRALDFVDSIDMDDNEANESGSAAEHEAFFSLAGIWADREITQDSLRQKAWSHQK